MISGFYIFFHSHPFHKMLIVNGKFHCGNDTFTDARSTCTSLLAKKYLSRIQIIFMTLESAFYWLFCLEFLFKLVIISKSYAP